MISKHWLITCGVASAVGATSNTLAQPGGQQLEEVLVTAQRRVESLLDTPVTVTAIGGDTLEDQNIRDLTGLTALIPGLEIEPDGGRTAIRLRGIATADGAPAAENIAALHVDNVYISHRTSLAGYFYDVERVEVLQGPQGTLYGRNTAAGAVNIISRRPNQELEGAAEIDVGSYNSRRLFGMLNVPVTDRLALRGAFQTSSREGYFESNIDETTETYGRLGMQWDASDRVSVYTKLDFGDRWRRGNGVGLFGSVDNSDPDNWIVTWYDEDDWYDDSRAHPEDARTGGSAFSPDGVTPLDAIDDSNITNEFWGIMTEVEVGLGDNAQMIANLARIEEEYVAFGVGIEGERAYCVGVCWAGIAGQRIKGTPWVENVVDVRFQGTAAGQLDWTVGLFYWEDDTNEPGANPEGISFHAAQSLADSDAIYGQVTWTPAGNERLHFTVGGRKTNDWKQWDFQVNLFDLITVGGSGGVLTQEWDNTDYKVGVSWDLDNGGSESLLYANASSGYRAGSWFPGPIPYYNPEFVDAFEIGWKGRMADDRLDLNFNTYYYDYQDVAIQFDSFNTISMEDEIGYANMGNAEVFGANFSGTFVASDNDLISFNLDYTDAEIKEFDFDSVLALFPPFYSLDDVFDWSGLQIPNTTPWRLTFVWNHVFNLDGGGTLDSRIQSVWNDERFSGYRETTQVQYEFPGYLIDSYATLDWNVNYRPASGDWHLGFYVLNLTDERIASTIGGGNTPPGGLIGTLALNPPPNGDPSYLTGQLRPPRTVGFRIGYDF